MKIVNKTLRRFLDRGTEKALFDLGCLLTDDRGQNQDYIRRLCAAVPLGDGTVLCRSLGRYKILVDALDYGLAPHLMLDGYWEMWVTEVIAREVHEGMIVADIGANIGYFSTLMAELVGPRGKVHAFEPNPRLADLLKRTLEVNGFGSWVSLHQVALAEVDGANIAFVVPDHEPKNGHLQPWTDPATEGVLSLETVRLDSRAEWRDIQLAKIDVEGAEEMIWAGATGLLESRSLRTVILEFTPGRYADPRAFLERIVHYGFSLSNIEFRGGAKSCTMDEILQAPAHEDRMLLLKRS